MERKTKDGEIMNCCIWGNGVIPIRDIYQKMVKDGYTGDFAIEYVKPDGNQKKEEYVEQLNKFLR